MFLHKMWGCIEWGILVNLSRSLEVNKDLVHKEGELAWAYEEQGYIANHLHCKIVFLPLMDKRYLYLCVKYVIFQCWEILEWNPIWKFSTLFMHNNSTYNATCNGLKNLAKAKLGLGSFLANKNVQFSTQLVLNPHSKKVVIRACLH